MILEVEMRDARAEDREQMRDELDRIRREQDRDAAEHDNKELVTTVSGLIEKLNADVEDAVAVRKGELANVIADAASKAADSAADKVGAVISGQIDAVHENTTRSIEQITTTVKVLPTMESIADVVAAERLATTESLASLARSVQQSQDVGALTRTEVEQMTAGALQSLYERADQSLAIVTQAANSRQIDLEHLVDVAASGRLISQQSLCRLL